MLIGEKSVDGCEISSLKPCSEKKVRVKCETCGTERRVTWANYTKSQKRRDNDNKTPCIKCQSSRNIKLAIASGPWNKGKRIPDHERSGKPYITTDGYRAVFQYRYDRNYHSQWANYRKEHMVVMEEHLNRELLPNEVIHHIDGDKLNNEIMNLWLTDSAGHRLAHISLQKIGYYLFSLGLIRFDSVVGEYLISDKLHDLLRSK